MVRRDLIRRNKADREWRDEMESHVQMGIDGFLAQGMSPEEARTAALLQAPLFVLTVYTALFTAALPLPAHHSIAAEFDASKPVRIQAKAVRLDWANPHCHLFFEVATPAGGTEQWAAEMPPPNTLCRAGWSKTTITEGEELTVSGFPAKDGVNLIWDLSVDFFGRRGSLMTYTRTGWSGEASSVAQGVN